MPHDLLADLEWRGLVHQCTHLDTLRAELQNGQVTLYCGFDPTALSLHVGSLVPLVALARFQRAGHRVLAVVGGATGLIGDPSGKSAERVLQTDADVAVRTQALKAQIAKFVEVQDSSTGAIVNNLDWTQDVNVLEFLRDVGKHFSVNAMVARDSVRSRLDREGDGISFTEFSYMLLQAYDFLHLHEAEACTLQVGGSDQWGNMCSGTDLIRRKHGRDAFALTFPLLTMSNGEKFGKTANGAVWLDPAMTTPWEFYQFWLNTEDADVIRMLKMLTFVSQEDVLALEASVLSDPQSRAAQRRLAQEMTTLVHGAHCCGQMTQAAGVLFSKQSGVEALSAETLGMLTKSLPTVHIEGGEAPKLAALLVQAGLESSLTKATQVIRASDAVAVNGQVIRNSLYVAAEEAWLHGRFLLIRKGKKSFALVERTPSESTQA